MTLHAVLYWCSLAPVVGMLWLCLRRGDAIRVQEALDRERDAMTPAPDRDLTGDSKDLADRVHQFRNPRDEADIQEAIRVGNDNGRPSVIEAAEAITREAAGGTS